MAIIRNLTLAISSKPPSSIISSIQHIPSRFPHPFKCPLPNFSRSSPYTTAGCGSDDALSAIQAFGVIACLRADSVELAMEAARAALDGGVTVLEIVISNPGVFEILERLVEDYPTKTLGVGTVLSAEHAKNAIKFGAQFLLSPAMVQGILDNASCYKALYIPGAMTPTEILSAFNAGAKLIKVYPVSTMGGVQYITALKKTFPHIPLIASQGITLAKGHQYNYNNKLKWKVSTMQILLMNILPKEQQQLFYQMLYSIKKPCLKEILRRYTSFHALQLCMLLRL